jgi:hypothetical protein
MNLLPRIGSGGVAIAFAILFATTAQAQTHGQAAQKDPDAIRHALMATFDRPQARLRVDPIVIQGDSAVAGWIQGERGGRALLKRKTDGQGWEITMCAGDGLKDAAFLRESGLTDADAKSLAASLASAESTLGAAELARFSSFDGIVRMGPNGEHPPAHSVGGHHPDGQKHAH